MAGPLVLGPVVFQGFELPERLRFGGRQSLAVHDLVGGGRVVDAMGANEEPITWSGFMAGAEAAERLRVLERLRRSGAVLPLSWEGWLFTAVIERLRVSAEQPNWIGYEIRACVVTAGDLVSLAADVVLDGASALAGAVAGFGGITGTAAQVAAASGLLQSGDPAVAIAAAGSLAQMVAGNVLSGVAS